MYANVSYMNNSILEFADDSQPLVVGSCGHYRFSGNDLFHTRRPEGRVDYQLLYVAGGTAHFYIEGEDRVLSAGNMALYYPGQVQEYVYYGEEQPEIFWIHFTGSNVDGILKRYGITESTFCCGSSDRYSQLFRKIILELKTCCRDYEEVIEMLLRQIFIQIRRNPEQGNRETEPKFRAEMETAIQYFHEHYMEPVCIEEYAHSRSMSVSWFLRCFKQYTKQSPMQYITSIRLNNAINLLENTDYNITEVAAMTGYENPLYFSRIFHKVKGISPSGYRKLMRR